jgi:hypothetical protein
MPHPFLPLVSNIGLFFIFITLFSACSRIPKGVIAEKKMQKILVDMQLAEAMIYMYPQEYSRIDEKKALYQSVFDKYHLTEAEYDSSLIWYGKNMDIYMQVCTQALAEVKQKIEEIGDIKPEMVVAPNDDSVDIWIFKKYYELSPEGLSNTVIFDFQPSEAYSSGSTFVMGLRVWGVSPEMKTPLTIHLRADQNDTTLMVKTSVDHNGYYEMKLKTIPTQKVKRVYGYIRSDIRDIPYHKIYLDEIRMMKYRYGSTAIERLDSLKSTPTDGV